MFSTENGSTLDTARLTEKKKRISLALGMFTMPQDTMRDRHLLCLSVCLPRQGFLETSDFFLPQSSAETSSSAEGTGSPHQASFSSQSLAGREGQSLPYSFCAQEITHLFLNDLNLKVLWARVDGGQTLGTAGSVVEHSSHERCLDKSAATLLVGYQLLNWPQLGQVALWKAGNS